MLEYLSKIQGSLPEGVRTELGPDATGVGWVFQYALVDRSEPTIWPELRSHQDWYLRYALQSVPGVAEVAGIGGFQKQYQITVDPNWLQAYNISIRRSRRRSAGATTRWGGRLLEWSGTEYMVRGRGYVRRPEDLEQVVLRAVPGGTPVRLGDVAAVSLGQIRRGLADLNGKGRRGRHRGDAPRRNALTVIERVKERPHEMRDSLPEGVEIVTTYDRSELIQQAIDNLKGDLILEMIIVCVVIPFFLWHFPSAVVPIITIPVSVVLAFIPMYHWGISANIMSLAGIAISIGVLVDGAIVEVENAYKKLEHWQAEGGRGISTRSGWRR